MPRHRQFIGRHPYCKPSFVRTNRPPPTEQRPVTNDVRQHDPPRRYFRDEDGRNWEVRLEPMPAFDRRAGHCLIFESLDIIRRVRSVPGNWFDLNESELRELSQRI